MKKCIHNWIRLNHCRCINDPKILWCTMCGSIKEKYTNKSSLIKEVCLVPTERENVKILKVIHKFEELEFEDLDPRISTAIDEEFWDLL